MSSLIGWLGSGDAQFDADALLDAMGAGTIPSNRCAKNGAGLAITSSTQCALVHGQTAWVALSGHATWEGARLSNEEIATRVANNYARLGIETLRMISGDFAIAIIDPTRSEALLAIDRMGINALNWSVESGTLVFGTKVDSINQHPAISPVIDPQGVFDYTYFHVIPGPRTVYKNQWRVLPGEYVHFQNGSAKTGRYWQPEFVENIRAPFDTLKSEFVDALRTGVRNATTGARVGAFLSGGTDSSTLAGLLGQVTGEAARTYSIGFDEPGYDEMGYARLAAKHFGAQHHEYYVTPDDVAAAIPKIADAYDQPFGNSSAVPTYYCAKLAHDDGIDRLLGGDGGDELFGGNERYAKQWIFSLYDRVPSLLRHALIEPLTFGLPGGQHLPGFRKWRRYVEQAHLGMPARMETYNLLDRFGHTKIFTSDFLENVDIAHPHKHLAAVYGEVHGATLISRMLALDFRITLADNDLPKVRETCHLAGVDIMFPMLDDAVMDFSLKLAPDMKLRGTQLRWFFKEALKDFLPTEIINKQKHGFGLPFGPWLNKSKALQNIVYDSLDGLRQRDIVRAEFLDELNQHVAAHPAYYGTMAWVLMMLEQWFRKTSR